MAGRVPVTVYPERAKKRSLKRRAKAEHTSLSEGIRRAIDAYFSGISHGEVRLLDAGTRKAEEHIREIVSELDRLNARLDAAFAQLSCNANDTRKTVN